MAVFNSLESHMVQNKIMFVLRASQGRAITNGMRLGSGAGINGWKTSGVKSAFCVPQSMFLDGAHREGHILLPGPQAQALIAML